MDGRHVIKREDVEWVVDSCHYAPHTGGHAHVGGQRVGIVNGLAVQGFQGAMLDIEAVALPGEGRINVTGKSRKRSWAALATSCVAAPRRARRWRT